MTEMLNSEPVNSQPVNSQPVDLLALTAEMVNLASPSFEEQSFVEWIERRLRRCDHLEVDRVGDNLVARTRLGRSTRVVLAGHTDTVPANGNETARVDGDTLWGLGSADMKGGLAVMLAAAETITEPGCDVTYVFYAREEVAAVHNGLAELARERPDLLAGDVALLGEPTNAEIEAGCQGTMRVHVTLRGVRAHPARPWMGRNAVHRAGPLLAALEAYEARTPVLDGCEFREALLALSIEGGVSGNVVPDELVLTVGHRFAPDRSPVDAEQWLRDWLSPFVEPGDEIEVIDLAEAAWPATGHPLLRRVIDRHGLMVGAKLGWTDVARFAALGVPAANFGPGDALLAHTAHERIERDRLKRCWAVVQDLLSGS